MKKRICPGKVFLRFFVFASSLMLTGAVIKNAVISASFVEEEGIIGGREQDGPPAPADGQGAQQTGENLPADTSDNGSSADHTELSDTADPGKDPGTEPKAGNSKTGKSSAASDSKGSENSGIRKLAKTEVSSDDANETTESSGKGTTKSGETDKALGTDIDIETDLPGENRSDALQDVTGSEGINFTVPDSKEADNGSGKEPVKTPDAENKEKVSESTNAAKYTDSVNGSDTANDPDAGSLYNAGNESGAGNTYNNENETDPDGPVVITEDQDLLQAEKSRGSSPFLPTAVLITAGFLLMAAAAARLIMKIRLPMKDNEDDPEDLGK